MDKEITKLIDDVRSKAACATWLFRAMGFLRRLKMYDAADDMREIIFKLGAELIGGELSLRNVTTPFERNRLYNEFWKKHEIYERYYLSRVGDGDENVDSEINNHLEVGDEWNNFLIELGLGWVND